MLWNADETSHLIAIATFGLNPAGLAVVEETALMVVSENWIPYNRPSRRSSSTHWRRTREQSVKGLRYNLPAGQPIAAAMLPRRQPRPAALYVVPAEADDRYEAALEELIAARPEMDAWVWRTGIARCRHCRRDQTAAGL